MRRNVLRCSRSAEDVLHAAHGLKTLFLGCQLDADGHGCVRRCIFSQESRLSECTLGPYQRNSAFLALFASSEIKKTCRHHLRGNCTSPSRDKGHPPVPQNYTINSGSKFGEKCVFRHSEVDCQPSKKPKKSGGKGSVALLKNSKQLGCSRIWSRRNPSRFFGRARAACTSLKVHNATSKIRERKYPSKGVIQQSEPHERGPSPPKFEDTSQEETLQQERCARRDAWEMAKTVHKLKEMDKATFHSLTEVRSLPAPSSTKLEEDSGASVHMLSRKD